MEEIKDTIVLLIQLATPFAILYLGFRDKKKEKDEAKLKQLEREAAEGKRKELNTMLEDSAKALQEARQQIENLSGNLSNYSKEIVATKKQLSHVAALNKMNGRYTHELAQLMMVLAEGIRDQHLDGNITKAIAKYRKFESDALGSFVIGDQDDLPE